MKYKNNLIQIACDGGAATGKSTGAKMISKKYKLKFLSSGLLYRYASFLILKYRPENELNFIRKKFKYLNYNKLNKIKLHTPKISEFSSIIAKKNQVRNILKKYQTNFSKKYKNCCIEGRDIATKILPNSDIKFFFKCNLEIAATRRYKELKKKHNKIKLKDVKKALRRRNILDTKKPILLKHRNCMVIDTGKLTNQRCYTMSRFIDKILKSKYENRTSSKNSNPLHKSFKTY